MKAHKEQTLCVVCGARCTGRYGGEADTCDYVCKRAKRKGLTRAAYLSQSIKQDERQSQQEDRRGIVRVLESTDYNQPYLAAAYSG